VSTFPPRNRDSEEYLAVSVTADVTLTTQQVEIAVTLDQPGEDDWLTATWVGTAGTTRQARLTPAQMGTDRAPNEWLVFVRITDTPEIPVLLAGSLRIT
jgi:hypothetical protein